MPDKYVTYTTDDYQGDPLSTWQYNIGRFENIRRPPRLMWPHEHDYHEVIWLREGHPRVIVDDVEVTIEPGTLFFIAPGQVHIVENYEDVRADVIVFTEEFLRLNFSNTNALMELFFLDDNFSRPYFIPDEATKDSLDALVKLLYDECADDQRNHSSIASLLYVFLSRVQKSYLRQENIFYKPHQLLIYNQFRQLVERHYREQRPSTFYAEELCMSPHNLNETVKKVSGKTIGDVIKARTILETKRLLLHTTDPIGQISEQLGFKDFSYFSRQFRKYTGLTPESYRKKMYQKYQSR